MEVASADSVGSRGRGGGTQGRESGGRRHVGSRYITCDWGVVNGPFMWVRNGYGDGRLRRGWRTGFSFFADDHSVLFNYANLFFFFFIMFLVLYFMIYLVVPVERVRPKRSPGICCLEIVLNAWSASRARPLWYFLQVLTALVWACWTLIARRVMPPNRVDRTQSESKINYESRDRLQTLRFFFYTCSFQI